MTLVTWDGGGNEPPAIAAAEALCDRGHDVRILGYESQRKRLTARGLRFSPLRRASAEVEADPWPRPRPALVMASDAQLADVREALTIEPADVVVVDCLSFGALAAVETMGAQAIVLVHTPAGCAVPPGGLLDRALLAYVNNLRSSVGLGDVPSVQAAWATGSIVATTIREMDPQPSSNTTYVGRVVPRRIGGHRSADWDANDGRPLVVASFTTAAVWDQRSRIERTLSALADAPVRVLVTTGDVRVDSDRIPPNAVLTPFVPHDDVLPSCRLLVTHGGHGGVIAALAHGVPMVCLPNSFSDQPAIAARVEELGVGVALDGDNATPAEIGAAVRRVLADPSFAASAHEIQPKIREAPGAAGVADAAEAAAR